MLSGLTDNCLTTDFLKKKIKPYSASFHGVNARTMADSKRPR